MIGFLQYVVTSIYEKWIKAWETNIVEEKLLDAKASSKKKNDEDYPPAAGHAHVMLIVGILCFENVFMDSHRTLRSGRTLNDSYGVSERNCGSVASLQGLCLPNWKLNVPAGQLLLSQGSNCVEVVLDQCF
ncbi:hypothetical protein TNCV_2191311 [Trichonephila clavipes]|nr:hypothetical protein TNCV_2191311 [Trichonephila clavipes]